MDAPMRSTIRLRLSAAALTAFVATPALAQKQFGAAGVLCSQYVKGARGSDIVYHQASNWLLGYVSGVNAAPVGEWRRAGHQSDQRSGAEIGGGLLRGQSLGDHRKRRRPMVCNATEGCARAAAPGRAGRHLHQA